MAKIHVRDVKGDGNAWLVVYRGNKRSMKKIGAGEDNWKKARELKRQLEAEDARRRAGLPDPLPMAEVLEEHFERHVRHLKHSTRQLQEGQIHNHLIPAFGDRDARELDALVVRAWAEGMVGRYSPAFVRGCANVLAKALKRLRAKYPEVPDPRAWELAAFFTAAETARATEIRQVDSWTHDEAERLLAIVRRDEPRYYPVVLFLLHTGCRRGEALGIQWPDVDFARRRVWIRRARVNGRTVTPKHRRPSDAPRSVRLTPELAEHLIALQRKAMGLWVFASRSGSPMEETTLSRAWGRVKETLGDHGVRPLVLHSLRHTFATLSLEAGRSVKWVSAQLGHRDATITLNTYAHALPDDETDLSYLPGSGAGTNRHPAGTSRHTEEKEDSVSS